MSKKIVMLCGGVGGARGALAFYENHPPEDLTFIVNTGDDFRYLGLEIWPDWDTVLYHLSGVQDSVRGWGRADEGTRVMEEFRRFGAPTWFHLGDRDIALHQYRTWRLGEGDDRSSLAGSVCESMGVEARLLPLTEGGLNTRLQLASGREMDFQKWFVGEQCGPAVARVVNERPDDLALTRGVEPSLQEADLLIFAPSNPYLSLGPMLAHQKFASLVRRMDCPKMAVSPLIGGKALKGPLDRLIETLSPHRGQQAMAHYWAPWAGALLLPTDEIFSPSPIPLLPCPTLLKTPDDRAEFYRRAMEIGSEL